MRRQTFTKAIGLGLFAAMFGAGPALLAGCEHFDPVRTEDLCKNLNVVSMRCPQCQNMPYESECAICTGNSPESRDREICREPSMNSAMNAGEGGAGEGSPTSGEGGSGGEIRAGASGGAGRSTSGVGGMSGGGTGGTEPSGLCKNDLPCMAENSLRRACDVMTGQCVECTDDSYCTGTLKTCNLKLQRCQDCVGDENCANGNKCDTTNMVCVECKRDEDCTNDPLKNACDTRINRCVDCVTDMHCSSDPALTTCDMRSYTCVDCLEDRDCGGATPACDVQTRTCLGCIKDVDCKDRTLNACDTEKHTCVDCIDNDGCDGTNKFCDTGAQKCVQCLVNDDCPSKHCVDKTCVECETDANCKDPAASHCDTASHKCVGCTSNTQCGHLTQTRACDIAAKRCVQCNDDTTCSGKACIRATHMCSNVTVGSLSVCSECAADSQCMTNMKCVELRYDSQAYGTYCVFTRASRSGGSCSNARPYSQQLQNARSVDGTTTNYCIPFMRTTCPGVLDVALGSSGQTCEENADCGLGTGDALCSDGKCTYSCSAAVDCPVGLDCPTVGTCG